MDSWYWGVFFYSLIFLLIKDVPNSFETTYLSEFDCHFVIACDGFEPTL